MSKLAVRLKYTGTAPGANTDVYTIFSTVATAAAGSGSVAANLPRDWAVWSNVHSYHWDIKHSQAGTVRGYHSLDGGTTWVQFYDTGSMAAPTYTSNDVVPVEGFRDFKFEWVNGGSAQATWVVNQDVSIFP